MITPITATTDLTINQGDDFVFQIRLKYNDSDTHDITGNTYRCRVRESAKSDKVVIDADCTIVDAEQGLLEIHFKDEDTRNIKTTGSNYSTTSKYTYDLVEYKPNGTVTRLLQGMFYVSPGISWR